ncbi:MAG: DedA family protein [Sphingomonadales bacterium]|nr:DedA family protein [Sphingomonadales bacterium]
MFIDFDHLIRVYGGLAVFAGAALEGEAAVTAGGYLAHRGMISPYLAAACAFAGSVAADQFVFFIARFHRDNRFIERARQRPAFSRAIKFIEHRPILFCTVFRFIYGMRTAGPIAIGVSRVPTFKFVVLNLISAALWAAIFTFIGYRFGKAFEAIVDRMLSNPWVIGSVAMIIVAAAIIFVHRRKVARHSSSGNI